MPTSHGGTMPQLHEPPQKSLIGRLFGALSGLLRGSPGNGAPEQILPRSDFSCADVSSECAHEVGDISGPINAPTVRRLKHSEILREARARLFFHASYTAEDAVWIASGEPGRARELYGWIEAMLEGQRPYAWLRQHYPTASQPELRKAQLDYLDKLIAYLEAMGK